MDRQDRDERVREIFRRHRSLLILAFLSGLGLTAVGDRAVSNLEFPSAIDWLLIVPTLTVVCTSTLRFSRIIQIARKADLSVAVPWGDGFKWFCFALIASASAGMGAFSLVLAYRFVGFAWSLWRELPQLEPPILLTVVRIAVLPVFIVFGLVFSLIFMQRARRKFVSCVRAAAGICVRCGYSLEGIDSPRCSECGTLRPTLKPMVDKAS